MEWTTYFLINGPLFVFTIVGNAFFIFCFICPVQEDKTKQPLKLLLGTLICCTVIFLVSSMVRFSVPIGDIKFLFMLNVVHIFSLSTSMTSTVWLNFFYFTQIVPAQKAACIWIRQNIKPIIYCIWFFERVLIMFDTSALLTFHVALNNLFSDHSFNHTAVTEKLAMELMTLEILPLRTIICLIATFLVQIHFLACLFIMTMSSGSTVIYLSKHMCQMAQHGQPFSCSLIRSQVRVTVLGLLQGLLFFFYALWTISVYIAENTMSEVISSYSLKHFTVINFYMAVTTFTVGAGHSAFRQRAANILLRAVKCRKVQQSEQGE